MLIKNEIFVSLPLEMNDIQSNRIIEPIEYKTHFNLKFQKKNGTTHKISFIHQNLLQIFNYFVWLGLFISIFMFVFTMV